MTCPPLLHIIIGPDQFNIIDDGHTAASVKLTFVLCDMNYHEP